MGLVCEPAQPEITSQMLALPSMTFILTAFVTLIIGWWLGRGAARIEYEEKAQILLKINEHNQRELDRLTAHVQAMLIAHNADVNAIKWPETL